MSRYATRVDGAFLTPLTGLRLPSRVNLVGEYVLGVNEAASIKNHANPAAPLTVQGVPTYNADHVIVRSSVTAGFGFLSGIIPDEENTLIVIRKNASTAAQPRVAGMDFTGSPVVTFGPRQYGADNYMGTGESAVNMGPRRPRPASAAEIYFEAAVASIRNPQRLTGGYGKMYWYAGGVQQSHTSTDLATSSTNTYRQLVIGSNLLTDSITNNNLAVYFVALYNRPLSAAEIHTAWQALVAYYATRSVTVV